MNFTFTSPEHGTCVVKLWATGRYGFSLPKKIDITTPAGMSCTYLYANKALGMTEEPANRTIVRIAVAAFLDGAPPDGSAVEIDPGMPSYDGKLTPVRVDTPRAPIRVRPGRPHARTRPDAAIEST
jgi:hypothetical protein